MPGTAGAAKAIRSPDATRSADATRTGDPGKSTVAPLSAEGAKRVGAFLATAKTAAAKGERAAERAERPAGRSKPTGKIRRKTEMNVLTLGKPFGLRDDRPQNRELQTARRRVERARLRPRGSEKEVGEETAEGGVTSCAMQVEVEAAKLASRKEAGVPLSRSILNVDWSETRATASKLSAPTRM
jgi:hypothetical protein